MPTGQSKASNVAMQVTQPGGQLWKQYQQPVKFGPASGTWFFRVFEGMGENCCVHVLSLSEFLFGTEERL